MTVIEQKELIATKVTASATSNAPPTVSLRCVIGSSSLSALYLSSFEHIPCPTQPSQKTNQIQVNEHITRTCRTVVDVLSEKAKRACCDNRELLTARATGLYISLV